MKKNLSFLLALLALSGMAGLPAPSRAQGFQPPPFAAGVPGAAPMQAISVQRHQARTLLYREAIEELRRNPRAAEVRECAPGEAGTMPCLPRARAHGVSDAVAVQPTGRRLALLIGNDRYAMPIPPLETPPRDVDSVAAVLKTRLGFDTRILKNAGKADIIRAVAALAREAQPADSVLLYYAGHGYLMDDTDMGYWIPSDASVKTAAGWISNTDISRLLAAIPARQLMLVSDSCFSGTLAREQVVAASHDAARDILRRRSVLVLSSGGEEPVSDEGRDGHSVFAWHLLRSLDALGSTTPGYDVYRTVRRGVSTDFAQRPQYGAVPSAGHEQGGEYLFDVRTP